MTARFGAEEWGRSARKRRWMLMWGLACLIMAMGAPPRPQAASAVQQRHLAHGWLYAMRDHFVAVQGGSATLPPNPAGLLGIEGSDLRVVMADERTGPGRRIFSYAEADEELGAGALAIEAAAGGDVDSLSYSFAKPVGAASAYGAHLRYLRGAGGEGWGLDVGAQTGWRPFRAGVVFQSAWRGGTAPPPAWSAGIGVDLPLLTVAYDWIDAQAHAAQAAHRVGAEARFLGVAVRSGWRWERGESGDYRLSAYDAGVGFESSAFRLDWSAAFMEGGPHHFVGLARRF